MDVCRECIKERNKDLLLSPSLGDESKIKTKCDICKKLTNCYCLVTQDDLIPSNIKEILDKAKKKSVDSPHITQHLNSPSFTGNVPSFIKGFDFPSIMSKLTSTMTNKSENMTKAIMLDELNYLERIIKDNPFDMNTEEIKQLKDYAKGLLLEYTKKGEKQ